MSDALEIKRSQLVKALKNLPQNMRERIESLKAEGNDLRNRPDLLWYLLLQSAATQGNSRGWKRLCSDPVTLRSVEYAVLVPLELSAREAALLAALKKAKVRMQTLKAPQLAANVARIKELGGVEEATKHMLSLPTRDEKFEFMRSFKGIGEKYGRNVYMDIYDPSFRSSIAVDERLKKVARALGFNGKSYKQAEAFYCAIATDAGLEPWELDRLLYWFTDYFLGVVEYTEAEGATGICT